MKMETIQIDQRSKTNTRANNRLRQSGYLPASIYGKGIETISVSIKKDDFRSILTKLGRNAVFQLEVPGKDPYTVIIKEIQDDPISRDVLHVDFQRISLTEEIKTDVAIRVTGMENLEKKRIVIVYNLDSVKVKCLPQDTPDSIDIDVSNFEIGDSFTVGDLDLGSNITIENDANEAIVSATEAKITEEPEEEIEDEMLEPELISAEDEDEKGGEE